MRHFVDNPIFENFVSPILCNDLLNFGLTPHTVFRWKVHGDVCMLYTDYWDFDNYYSDAIKLQDEINPPTHVLPAYSIKDVEKGLPDYLLCKTGDEYEVALEKIYNTGFHKAKRLPDALALMLKEVITKGRVNLHTVNYQIYNSVI